MRLSPEVIYLLIRLDAIILALHLFAFEYIRQFNRQINLKNPYFNTLLHTHAVTITNFFLLITSVPNCCCDPPVVISASFRFTLTNCVSAGPQVPQSA